MTRLLLFLATTLILALLAPAATAQVQDIPLDQESSRDEHHPPSHHHQHHHHHHPRNELYFLAGGDYQLQQLPVDQISHILYSFANVNAKGLVNSSNSPLSTDQGNNATGDVKELYKIKKQNRGVKVLLSIGGGSPGVALNFTELAANETSRQLFASSATDLVRDWGLDGIDIDWEYPEDPTHEQAADFVKLLEACRKAFDVYAARNARNYHLLITVAVSAVPYYYNSLNLTAMNSLVDIWHLMTYDFGNGDFNNKTDITSHTTNLYNDAEKPPATPFSSDGAVQVYLEAGIPPAKISMGVPTYGHAFEETDALVGSPYDGIGDGDGTRPYNTLPSSGAKVHYDDEAGASYSYDTSKKELISYDDPKSVRKKAAYVRDKKLGGAFFWEASMDKTGPRSLVATMARHLGPLDASQNLLYYPASQYANIRAGLPGE